MTLDAFFYISMGVLCRRWCAFGCVLSNGELDRYVYTGDKKCRRLLGYFYSTVFCCVVVLRDTLIGWWVLRFNFWSNF